jgi:hypothetical protein
LLLGLSIYQYLLVILDNCVSENGVYFCILIFLLKSSAMISIVVISVDSFFHFQLIVFVTNISYELESRQYYV